MDLEHPHYDLYCIPRLPSLYDKSAGGKVLVGNSSWIFRKLELSLYSKHGEVCPDVKCLLQSIHLIPLLIICLLQEISYSSIMAHLNQGNIIQGIWQHVQTLFELIFKVFCDWCQFGNSVLSYSWTQGLGSGGGYFWEFPLQQLPLTFQKTEGLWTWVLEFK